MTASYHGNVAEDAGDWQRECWAAMTDYGSPGSLAAIAAPSSLLHFDSTGQQRERQTDLASVGRE